MDSNNERIDSNNVKNGTTASVNFKGLMPHSETHTRAQNHLWHVENDNMKC